jgi:hypothetical protein
MYLHMQQDKLQAATGTTVETAHAFDGTITIDT